MAWTLSPGKASSLAIVVLLVLLAQPAAVLDAPAPASNQAPETGETDCHLLEQDVERALADAEVLAGTDDVELCLDEEASLTDPSIEERLPRVSLG